MVSRGQRSASHRRYYLGMRKSIIVEIPLKDNASPAQADRLMHALVQITDRFIQATADEENWPVPPPQSRPSPVDIRTLN